MQNNCPRRLSSPGNFLIDLGGPRLLLVASGIQKAGYKLEVEALLFHG